MLFRALKRAPTVPSRALHRADPELHVSVSREHLRQDPEDRQGGAVNGPRAYFHDPDGNVLEIINLTSYKGDEDPS